MSRLQPCGVYFEDTALTVPRIALVMDGARRHYDVAKALERRGLLECMFADWYAPPGSLERFAARSIGKLRPGIGQRMAERYADQLPTKLVRRNPLLTGILAWNKSRFAQVEAYWKWESERCAKWILKKGWGQANALYGYIRNIAPSLCERARQEGLKVIGEQMIAPAAIEKREVLSRHERWPGWEPAANFAAYGIVEEIERETWAKTDRIVAPSEYVRGGLIEQNVPPEKIDLVPYPAEVGPFQFVDRRGRKSPVSVGFVGQINLRKNAPIFFEVARRFPASEVRFVMIGRSYLNADALEKNRGHAILEGTLPRSNIPTKLAEFDIFFFPSACEGSSGAVIEAMATGLPIVTTPNSGTPVRDGIEGFIGPCDDVDFFEQRIAELVGNPERRWAMGEAARERVAGLTLDRYGRELEASFLSLHA